jgi:hypothetical protein
MPIALSSVISGDSGRLERTDRHLNWELAADPLREPARATCSCDGVEISVERDRFHDVGRDFPDITWRRVLCLSETWGALTCLELLPQPTCDAKALSKMLDAELFDTVGLGEIVASTWNDITDDTGARGSIVEVQDATCWRAAGRNTRGIFTQLLVRAFPRHSIVLARARPHVEAHGLNRSRFRRGALESVMEGRFDFERLGDASDWMWRRRAT